MKDIQSILIEDEDSVKMETIRPPVRQTNALSPPPEPREENLYRWEVPSYNQPFYESQDEDEELFISPHLVSEIDKLCAFDD